MPFEAKDHPISDILSKSQFEIPRNQRRYVWRKEHWQDLFDDLLFSIKEQKPHFLGSIVLEDSDRKDNLSYYTIIDGQQRLTTITLMLLAIMKHFRENGMMNDFLGSVDYLQAKTNRNQLIIMLQSEYHASLSRLIQGTIDLKNIDEPINSFVDPLIISKSRDKDLGNAIKFFYSAIAEDIKNYDDIAQRLLNIRTYLLDMRVVRIVSSSEEDSYTIFEILNARGQDLAPHELLKNYIMRYIQPVERRDEAKTLWEEMERTVGSSLDRFIKHYATHRYGDTRDRYSSPYQAIYKATRGTNIPTLFDDIKLKSEYYNRIIHPEAGKNGNCTQEEYEIFSFFKKRRFEQFRPILLSLIHQKERGKLDDDKYYLSLRYIYNFFVCYTIIGEEKSNKLEDVVFKYARILEEDYSDDLLQEFAINLKGRIPSYEWFLNAFKNVGWSDRYDLYRGKKNKDRVFIVLEVVEKYISQNRVILDFTIEHILPDSQSIKHAQIGNLIPLEERLNRKCADKDINAKFEIYRDSSFSCARNLVRRYEKQSFSPDSRTVFLAKILYNNILELNQFEYSKEKNHLN